MVFRCAVENEYSLARPDGDGYAPIDESLCFSTIGMTASQDVTDAIVDALDAQGIQLEQYYAELGHGQQEISVEHLPVLEAADTQILVRETIRAVATALGLIASLAPKPFGDQAGNGAHIHFSLWDERNRSEPVPRPGRAIRALGDGGAVRGRHPRAHPGAARPHRAIGELLPAAPAAALELGVRLLGTGQPGGDGPRALHVLGTRGALDQPRVQAVGRDRATRTSRSGR